MSFVPVSEFTADAEARREQQAEQDRQRRLEAIRQLTRQAEDRPVRPNARRPAATAAVEAQRRRILEERSIRGKGTADEPVPWPLGHEDSPDEVCAAELAARVRVMLESA